MAEIKYNEFGEVISVNGLTTGQHIGAPIQDADGTVESNAPYAREAATNHISKIVDDIKTASKECLALDSLATPTKVTQKNKDVTDKLSGIIGGGGSGGGLSLVEGEGLNITWDGDTTGKDTIMLWDYYTFCKVSDTVLVPKDVNGSTVIDNDGRVDDVAVYAAASDETALLTGNGESFEILSGTEGEHTVRDEYGDEAQIVLPSSGTYFLFDEQYSYYIASLAKQGSSKLVQGGADVTEQASDALFAANVISVSSAHPVIEGYAPLPSTEQITEAFNLITKGKPVYFKLHEQYFPVTYADKAGDGSITVYINFVSPSGSAIVIYYDDGEVTVVPLFTVGE